MTNRTNKAIDSATRAVEASHPRKTALEKSMRTPTNKAIASLAVAACIVGLAASAPAATWTGAGSDDDWSTGANWDTPTEPGSGDDATIGNGYTAVVNSSGEVANSLLLDGSTIEQTGGSLDLGLAFTETGAPGVKGVAMSITGGGRYELSGGSFNNSADDAYAGDVYIGDGGDGTLLIDGGDFGRSQNGEIDDVHVGRGANGDGLLRIESGSFYAYHDSGDFRLGVDDGTGRLEISGTSPTAIQVGRDFKVESSSSSLAFEIDAGGVTPISVGHGGKPDLVFGGALDISLLAAPPVTDISLITLQQAPSSTSGTFSGLAEGDTVTADFGGTTYGWDITYQGGVHSSDVILQDMHIIPEPATVALLGLGGAVMLSGRKRR